MADYFQPTVVQQTIPDADMMPIERLLLSCIFECERDGAGWYFFSEQGPSDMVHATRAEIEDALAASPDADGNARSCVADLLARADPSAAALDLDLSGTSWEFFFQDIVRRSKTLRYVSVVAAFTCSRMRPDGFGGLAVLITADIVVGKSTNDLVGEFLADAGLDEPRVAAPPNGDPDA